MKIITCTDDFIRYNIHVGEVVIYNGKHYTFEGISGYAADLKNPLNMLDEIPESAFCVADPFIGKRFLYNGYTVEVLQQNKNGTYSIQAYNGKGKKEGGRFAILKQDTAKLKPLQ